MKPHPNDPKGEAGSKKCPLHLLPPVAMQETAWVHAHGAKKYQPFNWRTSKVNATTYVAAIMRHLAAWQEGEDLDPESGRSHLAHVAASANILMDAQATGTLVDDRYKRGVSDDGPEGEDGLWADGWVERSNSWRAYTGAGQCPCDVDARVEIEPLVSVCYPAKCPTVGVARDFNWSNVAYWRYADET